MADTSSRKARSSRKPTKRSQRSKKQAHQKPENPNSWGALRDFFSCKDHQATANESRKKCKRNGCSGSLCNTRESSMVIKGPEAATHEAQKKGASNAADASITPMKAPDNEAKASTPTPSSSSISSASITLSSSFSSSSSSLGGSLRGMHLRRLSGCYECHMADPITGVSRTPSLRVTVLPCPDCGEVFVKPESLELHQAVRHAVSELGPEDTSRNIVEIIFQSSWLKKNPPVCKIERVLKVHNTHKTISRFEDYRDSIKSNAINLTKKHPRCVADGNELLRFHCASFTCSFGLNGSTNLCNSIPHCEVCSIIRDGFKVDGAGKICTMATSGRAHDAAAMAVDEKKIRAMMVCRVIAGRVKKSQDALEECDSVAAGTAGAYSNLDELFVFSPKAILPCFVVVYSGF